MNVLPFKEFGKAASGPHGELRVQLRVCVCCTIDSESIESMHDGARRVPCPVTKVRIGGVVVRRHEVSGCTDT